MRGCDAPVFQVDEGGHELLRRQPIRHEHASSFPRDGLLTLDSMVEKGDQVRDSVVTEVGECLPWRLPHSTEALTGQCFQSETSEMILASVKPVSVQL